MPIDANSRFQRPAPPREADPCDGILILDKPSGPTSHDMVDRIRRRFGLRKVGHGGTLDPLATGVLIMLLGRATKLSNIFLGADKTYTGTFRFGIATDSHDADGHVTAERDCSQLTREQVEAAMLPFRGDLMQTPPMVSAVKLDGIPLYKRARKGQEVERQPRLIHIYHFALTRFALPAADFTLTCTKGTYVRKIAADLGEALGCGAHLAALRRTRSGDLSLDLAVTAAELDAMTRADLARRVLPMHHFTASGNYRPAAG